MDRGTAEGRPSVKNKKAFLSQAKFLTRSFLKGVIFVIRVKRINH